MFQNLKEYWGNKLVKYDPKSLDNTKLSEDTKRFLQDVGIPSEFGISNQPWIKPRFNAKVEILKHKEKIYVVLDRNDWGGVLSIEEDTSYVYSINSLGVVLFYNSNVQSLVSVMTIYTHGVRNYSDEELKNNFEAMKTQMQAEDPYIFSDNGGFWTIKMDELESELTDFSNFNF
jgi:hypothetical protein